MYASGEIVPQINGKGLWVLRQQRVVHISIGHPDDFAGVVIKSGQYMWDVDRLSAFVEQLTRQYRAALRIFLDPLMQDGDDRVCRSGNQRWIRLHAHGLDGRQLDS